MDDSEQKVEATNRAAGAETSARTSADQEDFDRSMKAATHGTANAKPMAPPSANHVREETGPVGREASATRDQDV